MERFNGAYFPLVSLTENYGLPKGFETFYQFVMNKRDSGEYTDLFIYDFHPTGYERILSGYGMGFYELGIFGLIIPFAVYMLIRKKLKNNFYLFAFILFNFILFTAMSLNNALILFILGNMYYISSLRKEEVGNNLVTVVNP